MKRLALAAAALVLGFSPALAQNAPPVQRVNIRGTVNNLSGDVLTVDTAKGPVKVTLAPDANVQTVVRESLSDIKPGTFIGTAAMPQPDGSLKALEIQVFGPQHPPEVVARPFDLQPGSTMTNAAVSDTGAATVAGQTLTLTLKDGTKTVSVPPNTPIVGFEHADRSALAPGTRIVIINATPTADGFAATNVTAGKNGVNPPY